MFRKGDALRSSTCFCRRGIRIRYIRSLSMESMVEDGMKRAHWSTLGTLIWLLAIPRVHARAPWARVDLLVMEFGWYAIRFGRRVLALLGCLRKQCSILILGLEDAGKTSHLAGLRDRHDGASRGNLKDDVGTEVWFKDWAVRFYDLGPYLRVKHLWREWLEATRVVDGVVVIVDASTLREKGAEARELFQSLLSSLVSQKRTDMPILIVGNKMDLPEATGVDEYAVRQALDVDQVSVRRIGDHADWLNRVKVIITCASKPDRFENGLEWLLYQVEGRQW